MSFLIIFLITAFLVFLTIAFLVSAGILFWLKRVFKFPNPSYKNSLKVLVITHLISDLIFILGALVITILLYLINFKSSTIEAALSIAALLTLFTTFFVFHFFLKKRYQNNWKKSLCLFTVFGVIMIILTSLFGIIPRQFIISSFSVSGSTMEPNFHHNDYLLIKKFDRRFSRGDVIIFHPPKDSNQLLLKRIIGLPNEKVEIRDGKIFINGQMLNEPYINEETKGGEFSSPTLENNQYFVLGDNRSNSLDSRRFGPVLKDNIVGKVGYNVSNWFKK